MITSLFLITRNGPTQYDETAKAVVCAMDVSHARTIWEKLTQVESTSTITIRRIGTATHDQTFGVICQDFRAG